MVNFQQLQKSVQGSLRLIPACVDAVLTVQAVLVGIGPVTRLDQKPDVKAQPAVLRACSLRPSDLTHRMGVH